MPSGDLQSHPKYWERDRPCAPKPCPMSHVSEVEMARGVCDPCPLLRLKWNVLNGAQRRRACVERGWLRLKTGLIVGLPGLTKVPAFNFLEVVSGKP